MSKNVRSKSLEEVHKSIDTTSKQGYFRKLLAFMGPAYLVSVGYMDPGNWATDIAGGSEFGYKLIWVLLMSNIMAVLLQSLSARLGIVRGLDLAQASKETYNPFVNFMLYILAEIAIAACDLAEVLGMAIGLQLLFNIPLIVGVSITLLDTFLLLFLINHGMRKMEAFILALIGIIGVAFLMEMIFAQPVLSELASGFVPDIPNSKALYIAIGIIGATVMPHNLYLHSSLVQTRKFGSGEKSIKQALKFNLIDSVIALNLAFFVNAAILILAAATFYKMGLFNVSEINDAYKFLQPLLGTKWAPILFAVALIAAGQSSTLTGTLAGQIVMEGYLNLRIQPWIRRIITRLLAIIPAVLCIFYLGESSTGELLILSQVILSLQLGFAVIPLIHFVSDKKTMGKFVIRPWVKIAAWLVAVIIVVLNAKLVLDEIGGWMASAAHPIVLWLTVVPVAAAAGVLLLYITLRPLLTRAITKAVHHPHAIPDLRGVVDKPHYSRIAVAVDFSNIDRAVIRHALTLSHSETEILLIHVVETAGALILGQDIRDYETHSDHQLLRQYGFYIEEQGLKTSTALGFGNPKKIIPDKVNEFEADLLILGAHGHKMLKDILLGTTVDTVRHRVKIPVFIVR